MCRQSDGSQDPEAALEVVWLNESSLWGEGTDPVRNGDPPPNRVSRLFVAQTNENSGLLKRTPQRRALRGQHSGEQRQRFPGERQAPGWSPAPVTAGLQASGTGMMQPHPRARVSLSAGSAGDACHCGNPETGRGCAAPGPAGRCQTTPGGTRAGAPRQPCLLVLLPPLC